MTIATAETASAEELRELFSWDQDTPLPDTIQVCAGEWCRVPDTALWLFWADEDPDDEPTELDRETWADEAYHYEKERDL